MTRPCRNPWCGTGKAEERRGSITISVPLIHELRIEAKRRGLKVEDLAATILRAVVADDLYAAVIDR